MGPCTRRGPPSGGPLRLPVGTVARRRELTGQARAGGAQGPPRGPRAAPPGLLPTPHDPSVKSRTSERPRAARGGGPGSADVGKNPLRARAGASLSRVRLDFGHWRVCLRGSLEGVLSPLSDSLARPGCSVIVDTVTPFSAVGTY